MNGEQDFSAVEEKYALLKEELIKIGGCVSKNRFVRNKDGRLVETSDDYFLWLYDIFLQLSMLELSCMGNRVVPEQVAMARDIASGACHEDIIDVICDVYGNEDFRTGWDDVVKAQPSSVYRMVVEMKKNLHEQAELFCSAFATAVAANGGSAFDILKQSTTLSLAACVRADGEVTPEEEDKLSNCFIVTLINDIARRLANFGFKKDR